MPTEWTCNLYRTIIRHDSVFPLILARFAHNSVLLNSQSACKPQFGITTGVCWDSSEARASSVAVRASFPIMNLPQFTCSLAWSQCASWQLCFRTQCCLGCSRKPAFLLAKMKAGKDKQYLKRGSILHPLISNKTPDQTKTLSLRQEAFGKPAGERAPGDAINCYSQFGERYGSVFPQS